MNITPDSNGVIAFFAALTIFLLAYAIYAPVKAAKARSLDEEVFGVREQTIDADDSIGRYARPILDNFLPQMPDIPLGEEQRKGLEKLLLKSGNPWNLNVNEFLGLSLALGFLGALIGGGIAALGVLPEAVPPVIVLIFLAVAGLALPYSTYNTRREKRVKEVEKELPEALDLLTITISSGQTFETALAQVCRQMPDGLLKREFVKISTEFQAGGTIERALLDFTRRYDSNDLESFAKAIIQTNELGASVTQTLAQQAALVRSNYEARVEKMIAKLSSVLFASLIPTMIPAMMLVFLAPTLSTLTQFLG